ncbi:TolC family protein [Cytophagaceae bacterium DM2B3-1]|uniref:TolC family protein n=1 Tax=Xanthocytophaga flava TaxID=3048013 RepID=A0ABT7CTJ9_9BACT|nr:TolC family protein [Xanthocytophaga flavus]MDJ1497098.1 TolC family protein [Xanthocytophaga flavus]
MKPLFAYVIAFLLLCSRVWGQSVLSMAEAVQQARSNNPTLKVAGYNLGIAQSDQITATLRPNLTLNNQSLFLLRQSLYPEGTSIWNRHNQQIWWQLTKTIQWPGQRQNKIELSTQNYTYSQKVLADQERNISLDVAQKWLDVWLLRVNTELINQAKTNADSLVRINTNRLKNQVITLNDLTRTELLAEQYALQLSTSQQEYVNELSQLKFMLGTTDSLDIAFSVPIESIPITLSFDSLLNQTLSRRTDMAVAQAGINASEVNIRLQKSLAIPQPQIGVIWNPQNSVPYLGFFGTIDLPFFNRNQGEIQKSKIVREQAIQNQKAVTLQIQTELRAAYDNYQVQRKNVDRFQTILNQSDKVLNTVRYAYLRGGTSIIDFLEAQRSWVDTRQLYYNTVLSYRQSYLQLLSVSGLISQL